MTNTKIKLLYHTNKIFHFCIARRKADLAAKNPETAPWKKFEKKLDEQGPGFIQEKIVKSVRHREQRAETRAEKKAKRRSDEDLQHTFTL